MHILMVMRWVLILRASIQDYQDGVVYCCEANIGWVQRKTAD